MKSSIFIICGAILLWHAHSDAMLIGANPSSGACGCEAIFLLLTWPFYCCLRGCDKLREIHTKNKSLQQPDLKRQQREQQLAVAAAKRSK